MKDNYEMILESPSNLVEDDERINRLMFFYFLIAVAGLYGFWSIIGY